GTHRGIGVLRVQPAALEFLHRRDETIRLACNAGSKLAAIADEREGTPEIEGEARVELTDAVEGKLRREVLALAEKLLGEFLGGPVLVHVVQPGEAELQAGHAAERQQEEGERSAALAQPPG